MVAQNMLIFVITSLMLTLVFCTWYHRDERETGVLVLKDKLGIHLSQVLFLEKFEVIVRISHIAFAAQRFFQQL